jgi:hypothetical protein
MCGGIVTASQRTIANAIFMGVLVAIAANAMLYVAKTANPLIAADDWYYLDTIVRKAAAGELSFSDLLIKRSYLDHSQPLRKLVLLFEYRYFDLDYGIGGIIGVMAAFLNLGIIWRMIRAAGIPEESRRGLLLLAFAALTAVYLSLNSAIVFSWPLLTLGYTSHIFILCFLWATWRAYLDPSTRRLCILLISSLLLDVVADDTALIMTLAAAIALMVSSWRQHRSRQAATVIAISVAAYIAYLMVRWLSGANAAGVEAAQAIAASSGVIRETPGITDLLAGLWKHAEQMPEALIVPLVASVAHRFQLRAWLGPETAQLELVIAALLVAAHGWFWWHALRGKENMVTYVATSVMLFFYGLIAGLLLARISLHGANFMWQPRYVLVFEWNIIALLLMAIGQICFLEGGRVAAASTSRGAFIGHGVLAASALLLLLLQLPLSHYSWARYKYASVSQQRSAVRMGTMAANPAMVLEECTRKPGSCRYDPKQRIEGLRFLKQNRLNLFSPSFRARNRLYPDANSLPQ